MDQIWFLFFFCFSRIMLGSLLPLNQTQPMNNYPNPNLFFSLPHFSRFVLIEVGVGNFERAIKVNASLQWIRVREVESRITLKSPSAIHGPVIVVLRSVITFHRHSLREGEFSP